MKAEVVSVLTAALQGKAAPPFSRPWLGWLVVALCRQRLRQRWLVRVAKERLARSESLDGVVPGLPDWQYRFHGRGLLLVGPGNENLDVDFHPDDDDGATIDPYFFAHRVLTLSRPRLPEQRLRTWVGDSRELLVAALGELRDSGLIGHPTSQHVFQLCEPLGALCDSIGQVAFHRPGTGGDWARRLGDDLSVREPGRATPFQSWALSLVEDREKAGILKDLVGVIDEGVLIQTAMRILEGPIDAATGRSIEALQAVGATPGGEVPVLARRMDPDVHNPFSVCRLARWCLVSGVWQDLAADLILRFSKQRQVKGFHGNPFDDEFAMLALEFLPDMAPPLVEQALRSTTPLCFRSMGAYLSIVDEPWSTALLLSVAEDSTNPTKKRFLIGCLQHASDNAVVERSRALLPPPPDFPEGQHGYSHEQVAFLNLRDSVKYERSRAMEHYRRLHPH